MPWLLIPLVLWAVGTTVDDVNQREKRERDARAFHARLKELNERLGAKEAELDELRSQVDSRNEHIRRLVAEIERLRAELRAQAA